jgi:hypothetical protein
MAKKKSSLGAVFLWLVMVVMVAVGVTEFYGPFQGWLLPTASNVRDRVNEFKDDYQKKKEAERKQHEKDEEARLLAEKQKADTDEIAKRSRVIGIDEYPRTAMTGSALAAIQTDGEVTPADLPMQVAIIPAGPKRVSPKEILAGLEGRKLVKGSREYKSIYSKLYTSQLARLKQPNVGEMYAVKLVDDSTFDGRLQRIRKDAAVFRTDNDAIREVQARKLHLKSLRRFFPERYSERFAAHYIGKVTVKPDTTTTTTVVAKVDRENPFKDRLDPDPDIDNGTDPDPSTIVSRLPELKKYNPSYTKTPKHLATSIQYFGTWLDAQSKRQGGRIANKLYAKQHGKQVVLYMEMSRYFLGQKKDVKQLTCEQFWQMWARECKNRGRIKKDDYAHIVMVDSKGKIVGGSKEKRSKTIWIK